MKLTNASLIIAIIFGVGLMIMKVPYPSLFLYFIPAIIIVNVIRIWEKNKLKKD